jgi:hypothetical protein
MMDTPSFLAGMQESTMKISFAWGPLKNSPSRDQIRLYPYLILFLSSMRYPAFEAPVPGA